MDDNLDKDFDETKRESLIKMGKRAAYVSPVVLSLLTSPKAIAGSYAPNMGSMSMGSMSMGSMSMGSMKPKS